jgi:hypothetical protein
MRFFSDNLFGEAGDGFGSRFDDGERRQLPAGFFQEILEKFFVLAVALPNLEKPADVELNPFNLAESIPLFQVVKVLPAVSHALHPLV